MCVCVCTILREHRSQLITYFPSLTLPKPFLFEKYKPTTWCLGSFVLSTAVVVKNKGFCQMKMC